jgi:hypothetical protein
MLHAATAVLVASLCATGLAQPAEQPPQPGIPIPRPPAPPPKTPEAVRKSFEAYAAAIVNDKGEDAAECVDQQTIKWYGDIRKWALTATREELAKLGLFNRLQAMLVRHRVPRAELEKMDGRKLFIHAVDQGWVGKNSVAGIDIGDVSITSTFAEGTVVRNGRPTKMKFQFVIEGGKWKLKLMPIMTQAEPVLQAQLKREGLTEDEYILRVLEATTGRKPLPDAWDPPK